MSTHAIFWRTVWKEYRLQRALWIAMALMTVALQWVFFETFSRVNSPLFLFWTAAGLPAFYLLGSGAMLFAGERENGTFEVQRSLPTRAGTVFWGKVVFSMASAAMVLGVASVLAFALSGWTLHPPQGFSPLAVLVVFGFWGVELFVWSVLFSLRTGQVLLSAVLGIAVVSVYLHLLSLTLSPDAITYGYWLAMPYRAAIAAVVALIDVWLAMRWFDEKRSRRQGVDSKVATDVMPGWFYDDPSPGRIAMVGRLLWLHVRQSGGPAAVLYVVFFLLAAFPPDMLVLPHYGNPLAQSIAQQPLLLLAFACVPVFGMLAFSSDQVRRRYRFLADHGVTPRWVWWSGQASLMPLLMVVLPVLLYFVDHPLAQQRLTDAMRWQHAGWPQYCIPTADSSIFDFSPAFLFTVGYVVFGFAAGQCCAMFLRSHVLAGLCSVLATGVLAVFWWMVLLFQIPWSWSALPILLGLILASRLRTRDWLIERNTWRSWWRPAAAIVIPIAAVLTAVSLYRIYQIPYVDLGPLEKELPRPLTVKEQVSLNAYAKHLGKGKNLDEESRKDLAVIGLALRYRNWLPDVGLLFEQEAYDRLIQWSVRPGQTPERLLAVERQLAKQTAHDSLIGSIQVRYGVLWRALHDDFTMLGRIGTKDPLPLTTLLWMRVPWERERALRLLKFQTYCELRGLADLKSGSVVCVGPNDFQKMRRWQTKLEPLKESELLYVLREQLGLPAIYRDEFARFYSWPDNTLLARRLLFNQTYRRATQLILALEAWKLQHGSLPKTLDPLVGPCLDRLPDDPYSHRPFLYFPKGASASLSWKPNYYTKLQSLPAKSPFLWSTGPYVQYAPWDPSKNNMVDDYRIVLRPWEIYGLPPGQQSRRPTSEQDVLSSGRVFPIP
ncbi:MAG: hypothetical protein ABFC77_03800 [Thermoguttaceae bacterium]